MTLVGREPRSPVAATQPSLGELMGVLSLGIDLGLGQPMEHILRQWVISLELAERLAVLPSDDEVLSFVTLIGFVGCHTDSHEQARWFGDDIRLRSAMYSVNMTPEAAGPFIMGHVGSGLPEPEREQKVADFMAWGNQEVGGMRINHCRVAGEFALRLGLEEAIRAALLQIFERWDGNGAPGELSGAQICMPVRVHTMADVIEVHHRTGGTEAAVEVVRARRGSHFDPDLADLFCAEAPAVLAPLAHQPRWERLIERQPRLSRSLSAAETDAALEATADYVDLKSPYTLGHSRAVADLAAEAARGMGLPEDQVDGLRTAALLHDVGRLGVSNAIWDKEGPLSLADRERVRLRPYLTERMLQASPALAPLAGLAAASQERLDGSGYPRGLRRDALSPTARILAAADVYRALREPRPHRAALPETAAANGLRDEVRAGRLDGDAVEAVLHAAGHRSARRPEQPAGLTAREVEVLRLMARGLQTKQIGAELHITPKTVGHHIQHIYAKIGASNRVGASIFATEHGLL
jgi:HD-GYP domain-containing protein (c-di-GMP phosphodiesterase class II)